MTAVAVDVRGPGSKIDSSPNMSEGPATISRFSRPSGLLRPIFTLPVPSVEPVAGLALGEDDGAARELRGLERLGQHLHGVGLDTLEDPRAGQNIVHFTAPRPSARSPERIIDAPV